MSRTLARLRARSARLGGSRDHPLVAYDIEDIAYVVVLSYVNGVYVRNAKGERIAVQPIRLLYNRFRCVTKPRWDSGSSGGPAGVFLCYTFWERDCI